MGELPHQGWRVRSRGQPSHELLDLTLRTVGGSGQDDVPVLGRQVRRQERDAAEVKPSLSQQGEDHRVFAGGTGRGDAQIGLGLG
jgi:hypothetical protein